MKTVSELAIVFAFCSMLACLFLFISRGYDTTVNISDWQYDDKNGNYICQELRDDGGIHYLTFPNDATIVYKTLDPDEQAYAIVTSGLLKTYIRVELYIPKDDMKLEETEE